MLPLTLALSPNTKDGDGGPELGEREQIVGTLTQGCRPGLQSDAPLGLYQEEAASCRFTNVQSPDRFSGRRFAPPLNRPGDWTFFKKCSGKEAAASS